MPCSRARFSAVWVIESIPCFASIAGFTKRQPSVVSSSFWSRPKAAPAFAEDVGRAGHALDSAGQDQLRLAEPDGARRLAHRLEARTRTAG